MNDEVVAAIMTMAKADASMSQDRLDALAEICRGRGTIRRKLIGARSVRELLGEPEGRPISAPTLRRYVREGKITPIRLSCRKVRYDEREIQKLLNNGIEESHIIKKEN
jgi:transposase